MKDLIWDKTLSVDVREIDDDHRRLVELFNLLNQAVTKGEARNYIEALLEELICLTAWHFKHEERLMIKHGYKNLQAHKVEHQQLIESASELRQKFQQQGKTIAEKEIEFMEKWLTGHILGADMELGAFLGKVM
jgi:hemerythrin-like metal-binding protein